MTNRSRAGGFVLAAALLAGSCTTVDGPDQELTSATDVDAPDPDTTITDDGDPAPDPDPDEGGPTGSVAQNRPYMGMSVPRSTYSLLADVEADVGQQIELIRWFQRWDDDDSHPDIERAIAEGRRVHLSVRPAGSAGLLVPWADLATAEPGSETYEELIVWVDRMVDLPEGSYVTVNHEPETVDSEANGTAEEFNAMWRRWSELLDERGGEDLRTVWVLTRGAFTGPKADEWYPGDDWVDVVAVDPYNWYTCQGTDRPWVELEELLEPPLAFARDHDKPLAIAEFASVEDPEQPGRKAEWIRNATEYLVELGETGDLEYVSWFNVTAPGGTYPDCVWDYDTSPESAEAFGEMVRTLGDG